MDMNQKRFGVMIVCLLILCGLVTLDIWQTVSRSEQSAARGFKIIDTVIEMQQRQVRIETAAEVGNAQRERLTQNQDRLYRRLDELFTKLDTKAPK